MTDEEIKKKIEKLKNNAAFQMSLSGKELFHSNMIAMFLTQGTYPELSKAMTALFPPKTENNPDKFVVFDVLREYKNLDLIICYCTKENKKALKRNGYHCFADFLETTNENKNEDSTKTEETKDNTEKTYKKNVCSALEQMQYVIIENKFKSFPYEEQLDKYSKKLINDGITFLSIKEDGKKNKTKINAVFNGNNTNNKNKTTDKTTDNTTCYLLAPEKTLKVFFGDKKEWNDKYGSNEIIWTGISYENYKKELEKISKQDLENALIPLFIKKYCEFLQIMFDLYTECIENRLEKKKCFLSYEDNQKLLPVRIQDFYEKIMYNRVLTQLKKDNIIPQNSIEEVDDNGEIKNKKVPYFFSEAGYSRQTGILDFRYLWPNSFINTGVQIQGNSFRIVFSHEIDAFKKVFCISKWTGNYSKFKAELDKNKDTLKLDRFNKEEETTLKCIEMLDKEIQEKMKEHNINIPKIKFKTLKDNSETVYSYAKTGKYNFRYGFYDLNEVHKSDVKESYRDLDYDTLKTFLKVCCEVISNPNNTYEELRKKI